MNYKKIFFFAMAGVMTFTLFGCGKTLSQKAAEKYIETKTGAEVDLQNNGVTVQDKEGNTITTKAENKLPKDWPKEVPYYQKGKIEQATSLVLQGGKNFSIVIASTQGQAEIVDYYKEAFAAAGWEKQLESTSNSSAFLGFKKDKLSSTVAVTGQDGQAGWQIVQSLTLED